MNIPTPLQCIARAERAERMADRMGSTVAAEVFRSRGKEWRAVAALTLEADRAQRVLALDALDAVRLRRFHETLLELEPPTQPAGQD